MWFKITPGNLSKSTATHLVTFKSIESDTRVQVVVEVVNQIVEYFSLRLLHHCTTKKSGSYIKLPICYLHVPCYTRYVEHF